MPRAAIYARFSTDLQNEKSTEDQIDLCRSYAKREGLTVVGSYQDKARSGASMLGRDGLLQLLQDAQAKKFDVIVVEALDRLSRDMEDLAGIHKRMSFLGIEMRAVHEGTANTLMVGLRGLIGQMYREDNVHKIRRGMTGLVKQGLNAGGKAYGYRPDPMNKGKLLIVEEEAAIVLRIFQEFAAGKSPRHIAYSLNRDKVPPPRGKGWNASTINGNLSRGHGLLLNPIYAGKLVWNRVRMVKDPDTGRRISRVNPPEDWQTKDVPELQIVPTELFEKVQAHKQAKSKMQPTHQKRPKRLLSGLLRCGACGSGMTGMGTDRSGRTRICCSASRESDTCPDPRTFYLDPIERAVIATLTRQLRDPTMLKEYIETYVAERKRLAKELTRNRSSLERRLGEVSREIERLIQMGIKSVMSDEDLLERLPPLREEKKQLKEALEREPEPPNDVALHPAAMKRFEQQLKQLHKVFTTGEQVYDVEAMQALRDVVDKVTVSRGPAGETQITFEGSLTPLVKWQISNDKCVGIDGSGGPSRSIPTHDPIPFMASVVA